MPEGNKSRVSGDGVESNSPVPPGERDLANESFFEYGSRVGVWRILDTLDEFDIKSTFYACALALERNPEVGPEITRRGHEVMGHGNRWEECYKMDRDMEREAIKNAVDTITRTTGQRPLGWYTRYGPSVNTQKLVVEHGGFVYDCNAYNDDLPYYTKVQDKDWLVIPYSLEVNDYGFWRGQLSTPNGFFESAKSSFDQLYSEGATHPKMMSVGLHFQIIGKPSRTVALRQFLEYSKSLPGVWFARRIDIARLWQEQFPPA